MISFTVRLPGKPIQEHRFHPERRWRFDFAYLDQKIAVEVEGGAWSRGRHTRGSGFVKDMEKYNAAGALGWRVFRFTPQQMRDMEAYSFITTVLTEESGEKNFA